MISPQQVEEMIKAQMQDAQVQVQDLTGGVDRPDERPVGTECRCRSQRDE